MRLSDVARTPLTGPPVTGFAHAMDDLTRRHGMAFYMTGRFPNVLQRRLPEIVLATNWPEHFVARYEGVDLVAESKILQRLKSSGVPVIADELLHIKNRGRGSSAIYSALAGFTKSVALPVFDAEQRPYFFLFSGNRHHFEDSLISSLLLQSMRLLNGSLFAPRRTVLSARETD